MLMRAIAGATLLLSLGSGAHAGGHHGVKQRVSCSEVRYYVAKYSAATAEMYARSHGPDLVVAVSRLQQQSSFSVRK